MDLILSSGFLAFARHCGFLRAVEEAELPIEAVIGTSSGALIGSLWAAGIPAEDIARRVAEEPPWALMRWSWRPWAGLFALDPALQRLAAWLPERIEDLPRPFAAGVMDHARRPRLLCEGPLPAAVAASCAMPHVFVPVEVGGERFADGGAVDRVALEGWRTLRGERPVLVHLVERSAGPPSALPAGLAVVHTPRSRARFWDLGDVAGQLEEARQLAHAVIGAL